MKGFSQTNQRFGGFNFLVAGCSYCFLPLDVATVLTLDLLTSTQNQNLTPVLFSFSLTAEIWTV